MKNELNNITINNGMIFGNGKIIKNTIKNGKIVKTETTNNDVKLKIIKIKQEFRKSVIETNYKTIAKLYKLDEEELLKALKEEDI